MQQGVLEGGARERNGVFRSSSGECLWVLLHIPSIFMKRDSSGGRTYLIITNNKKSNRNKEIGTQNYSQFSHFPPIRQRRRNPNRRNDKKCKQNRSAHSNVRPVTSSSASNPPPFLPPVRNTKHVSIFPKQPGKDDKKR